MGGVLIGVGKEEYVRKNKAVVRHYIDALNAKDLAALDEIFSPNYINHSPRIGVTGKEATLKDYEQTFKAFPDRVGSIEELIAEGDKVFLYRHAADRKGGYVDRLECAPAR